MSRIDEILKKYMSVGYDAWTGNNTAGSFKVMLNDIHTLLSEIGRLNRAKTYAGFESYLCPLCEYDKGKFISLCAMHKEIGRLKARLEKAEGVINSTQSFAVIDSGMEPATIIKIIRDTIADYRRE